jgi:hypothetical protein
MNNGSVISGTPAPATDANSSEAIIQHTDSSADTAPVSGGDSPWYEKPDYAETAAWAKNRGYKLDDPALVAEALRGHFNAEKLIGLDRAGRTVALPKDGAPAEEWAAVYKKLGMPETANDYKLPAELSNDPVAKAFAENMHAEGMTQKQFDKAMEFVAAQSEQIQSQQEQEYQVKAEQAVQSLRQEWGQEFELRAETSKRAVRELGISQENAMAIEKALGVDVAAKLFFEIGKNIMEPNAEGITGGGSQFGMSKSEAVGRINTLMSDKDFGNRLSRGDAQAKAEWDKLNKIAYG